MSSVVVGTPLSECDLFDLSRAAVRETCRRQGWFVPECDWEDLASTVALKLVRANTPGNEHTSGLAWSVAHSTLAKYFEALTGRELELTEDDGAVMPVPPESDGPTHAPWFRKLLSEVDEGTRDLFSLLAAGVEVHRAVTICPLSERTAYRRLRWAKDEIRRLHPASRHEETEERQEASMKRFERLALADALAAGRAGHSVS